MKEAIESLKALQEVDLEIRKIEQEMATDNAEIERQQASIATRKVAIEDLTAKIEQGVLTRRSLETAVEESQILIKDRQNKLMNVQTNREYQSILKEIEDAKTANREREDELVRLMEQAEFYQQKKDGQVALCKAEETTLSADTTKSTQVAEKLSKKRETKLKNRVTKAKKVPANLLKKYELIREKRDGIAMAGVNNGVCHGCYMNVPPQLYNELLREDKLHSCPTCNRMLFYQPGPESTEKE
ncbi:MAG: hypothetical protein KJ950_17110 [Proteobacteria bacterium]|nr:hypothetical protein [Pseudomonadota bacterium]MBU1685769.1 hypothetical protein [Pseudomonadota bacterium]